MIGTPASYSGGLAIVLVLAIQDILGFPQHFHINAEIVS
jgi:hypothetical protein